MTWKRLLQSISTKPRIIENITVKSDFKRRNSSVSASRRSDVLHMKCDHKVSFTIIALFTIITVLQPWCDCDKTCQSPSDVIISSYFYLLTSISYTLFKFHNVWNRRNQIKIWQQTIRLSWTRNRTMLHDVARLSQSKSHRSHCDSSGTVHTEFGESDEKRRRIEWTTCSFYRAMLCVRGTSHGPVSVCLSVRPSVRHRLSARKQLPPLLSSPLALEV